MVVFGDQLPPGYDTRFDPGENIALAPVALADCLRDLHAGRLRMQMTHLLGLFAAESFCAAAATKLGRTARPLPKTTFHPVQV